MKRQTNRCLKHSTGIENAAHESQQADPSALSAFHLWSSHYKVSGIYFVSTSITRSQRCFTKARTSFSTKSLLLGIHSVGIDYSPAALRHGPNQFTKILRFGVCPGYLCCSTEIIVRELFLLTVVCLYPVLHPTHTRSMGLRSGEYAGH